MKKRISILVLTLLVTLLFGSLTVYAAAASSFTIDKTAKVNIGGDVRIGAKIPEGAEPVWTSHNVNIATVDEDGNVTGLRKGKTTVSVRIGLERRTCSVTVTDNTVKLNKKTATLYIGGDAADNKADEIKLKATVKGADNRIVWKTGNRKIARVSADGVVKAVGKGTVLITAVSGSKSASCLVTVKESNLSLDMTQIQLGKKGKGSQAKLTASVVGSGRKVTWESSNEKVAVVKNGKVTAKGEGEAAITAKANGISRTCNVKVIDGIAISDEQVLMYVGAKNNKGEALPSETKSLKTNAGKNDKVEWISSNEKVVSVDAAGKVTAVGAGKATITAKCNDKSDTCIVTVKQTNVVITDSDVSISLNSPVNTYQLNYQAIGRKTAISWTSSNKKVAVVKNGKITAKGKGDAEITAKSNGVEAKVKVTVGEYKPSITLNQKEYTLYNQDKQSITLKAKVDAAKGTNKKVTWASGNDKVATVDAKGKVKACGEGQTYITATAAGMSAECLITVKDIENVITVNGEKVPDEHSVYIQKGKTAELSVDVTGPSQSVSYKVVNLKDESGRTIKGVVKVDKKGLITAQKAGKADIQIKANGHTSTCHVFVADVGCDHEYGDWTTVKESDCKNYGQQTRKCTLCGYTETRATAKKEHAFGTEETKIQAACNKQGIAIAKCSNCDSTKVIVKPAGSHTWKALKGVDGDSAATCTEEGVGSSICTVCGITKQENTKPLGHSYDEWVIVKAPSKGEKGLKVRECVRCGAKDENEITYVIPDIEDPDSGKGPTDEQLGEELAWHDEFDGNSLNMENWQYELHDPGWVNEELQSYVKSDENVYVKDGKLYIQAQKTVGDDGKASYTSGRINTQNLHNFQYGRFEIRAKVPSGKGFLPAFWMMPVDESYYGQWPKCGEIDIMEVLGDKTDTAYGTLHFGEPHTQKQGTFTLESGVKDFSQDFHVYACEWDPGEFRFYVDDQLFYTVDDWFTKKAGFGEVAFPAPYDQEFYIILNLAVGGSWVGYPDESVEFGDNAQFVIDYVRVYQKDEYDKNVKKPDKELVLREPDKSGNYIINGDFAEYEDLTTSDNWQLHLESDGAATADVSDKELYIKTTKAGALDYSIQVVQANLPLEKGYKYKLSFDAYADTERNIITGVTAPDVGYQRYLSDTSVPLTTQKQNFEYTFDMTSESDANGRVEFCLGNQNSTAGVHITNVRLEKTGDEIEVPGDKKSILPDGNYVYNGRFEEGSDPDKLRLAYWDWTASEGTKVSVTQDSDRMLEVVVPETVGKLEDVIVKQTDIALKGGKEYVFTFDAYADGAKNIKAEVGGKTFEANLTEKTNGYKYTFETAEDLDGSELKFMLGTAGKVYIDNVRIQENCLLMNGDFSSGMVGYELYVNSPASASALVDSLNEDDACCITIDKTGSMDWYIQLKQAGITLEKDQWYKFSFDAKSTIDRTIMYALQRDGTNDDNWTPYSGTQKINVGSEYKNYDVVFQMTGDTDINTILSISMGAVNGIEISEKHTVTIDNIKLEKTEAQEEPPIEEGANLITNGDFAKGGEGWVDGTYGTGEADVSFDDGAAVYTVKNVGTDVNSGEVSMKQENLTLEKGAEYKVEFDVTSGVERTIKYALMDPSANYDWYGGEDIKLEANTLKHVEGTLTVEKKTSKTMIFQISMGKVEGEDLEVPHTITIDNVSLVKTKDGAGEEEPPVVEDDNLIINGDFADGQEPWTTYIDEAAAASVEFKDGKAVYNITNAGTADWHIQLKQSGLTMEAGQKYKVSMKVKSGAARTIKIAFMHGDSDWYGGADISLNGEEQSIEQEVTMPSDKESYDNMIFQISIGKHENDSDLGEHNIEIDDIVVAKIGGSSEEEPPTVEEGTELIKNGDFAKGEENWSNGTYGGAEATVKFENNKAVYEITKFAGDNGDSGISLEQKNLTLEEGASYKVKFKIKSSVDRKIKYCFLDPENAYKWYGGAVVELKKDEEQAVETTISVTEADSGTITFQIAMGKADDAQATDPGAHTIEISEVSVVKQPAAEVSSSADRIPAAEKPSAVTVDDTIAYDEAEDVSDAAEESDEAQDTDAAEESDEAQDTDVAEESDEAQDTDAAEESDEAQSIDAVGESVDAR